MQIDKTEIIQQFKTFIGSGKEFEKNSFNLTSFIFLLKKIEIVKLLYFDLINNGDYFYWEVNDYGIKFLSFAPLIDIQTSGENRLIETGEKIDNLRKGFFSNWGNYEIKDFPLIVGGIKFAPSQKSNLWDEYRDSDWFIPKFTIFQKNDNFFLIYNFIRSRNIENDTKIFSEEIDVLNKINPDEIKSETNPKQNPEIKSNSYKDWENLVNNGLKNISDGLLSKVVLSRELKIQLGNQPSIIEIIETLSKNYPRCYIFSFKRNNSKFFGASPEKLAKISNGFIEVDALAGSVSRGTNAKDDYEKAQFLLNSKKNLFEQRAVVNFIHNLLREISDEINFHDTPMIRKLPNIQHLWTVITAKLKDDIQLFDVLLKLHPTPAICGDPWKIAKDFILENEPHERGLYSGNIGWFNLDCNGEFAVGIRSALLKEKLLCAYAGCGIVLGSAPKAEFEESKIKLKPILSLFTDEKIYQS